MAVCAKGNSISSKYIFTSADIIEQVRAFETKAIDKKKKTWTKDVWSFIEAI